MLSLSFIFVTAKEIESLGGEVPSVFTEGQFTMAGAIGELYSVFRSMARGKAAAAPSHPTALVRPAVPRGQERAEDDAKLSSMWYGKRCYKTMPNFLFHGPVKTQPCLAEGASGLLLPLLYGCFPSLPGPFFFPADVTAGLRSALPGTGLRLLLAPVRSHSVSQEVALLWVSSTGGPTWAERGHPAHGASLPACPCCVGMSPSTLHLALP